MEKLSRQATVLGCALLGTLLVSTAVPVDEGAVADLMRRTFDFSASCPGGIILKLGNRQINSDRLQLSPSEAEAIVPILYDQQFKDQVDVWCKTAKLTQELAASIGRSVNTFNVEDLERYQGDIVLTKVSVNDMVDFEENPRKQRTLRPTEFNPDFALLDKLRKQTNHRVKRKVISAEKYQWRAASVPWRFDDASFTDSDREAIRKGIAHWEELTCIKFPENDNPGRIPHLKFIKDRGCYSYIGKDPAGQPVSIGEGCQTLGIVAHEIGHALGFSHEQSRPDRNRYTRINFSNVWPGSESNFYANKFSSFHTNGVPYDYASVMHYAAKDFARDPTRDTVEALDPAMRETMGQRTGLSFWDVKQANLQYCPDECGENSLEWERCQHNGYRNPKKCDECMCPEPWAPPFCEKPVQVEKCGRNKFQVAPIRRTFTPHSGKIFSSSTDIEPDTHCSYLFQAPKNMRIRMKFINNFEMVDNTTFVRKPSCGSHVEIRYKNLALAGPRFCGTEVPRDEFVSHGEEIMVTVFNRADRNGGFELEYFAENCGGCSSSSADLEQACLVTDLQECNDLSTGRVRKNSCFGVADDNKWYCCNGYTQKGTNCERDSTGPTTAAPRTATPTTAAPATATPTTAEPTTAAPATDAPTTAGPATDATTTAAPATDAPTTAAPATDAPTTAAPATDAPTTAAPATDAPTTAAPATDAPTTAAPRTAAPTTAAPTTTTAAPPTTAPTGDVWTEWTECFGTCGFCGRQTRRTICSNRSRGCSLKIEVRLCAIRGCVREQPNCGASTRVISIPGVRPRTGM